MEQSENVEQLKQQVDELSKLVRINGIINATLDIGKLLKLIMEVIKDIMQTEASSMLLYDEESHDLVFKVALSDVESELVEKYRLNIGQGIAGWVAQNRKTTFVNDVYQDERFDKSVDVQTGFSTRAIMCAPLLFKGKLLGVIQAINPLNRDGFTDHDMDLFTVFADQASLAVQNAIFFQNALAEARIKTELQAAQMIHDTSLMPLAIHKDGFSFTARSIHSREVSGVFHGAIDQGDKLFFYVGDVHIKGLPGGLKAARIDGLLKGVLSGNVRDMKEVAGVLRSAGMDEMDRDEVISLFVGSFSLDDGTCSFIHGGQMHPVKISGKSIRYIQSGAVDLGSSGKINMVSVKLKPGEYFAVLSPRFMRVKDSEGNRIDSRQVLKGLARGNSVDEKLDNILDLIKTFTGGFWTRSDFSIALLGL